VNNVYTLQITNMVTFQNFEILLITFKVLWYLYICMKIMLKVDC